MHKLAKLKTFFLSWSKKKTLFVAIGIMAVGGAAYAVGGGSSKAETVLVERGDIRQEVAVTGRVSSASSADLGFERGGRIASANVEVGQKVSEGKTLVVLDQTDLNAALGRAKASGIL